MTWYYFTSCLYIHCSGASCTTNAAKNQEAAMYHTSSYFSPPLVARSFHRTRQLRIQLQNYIIENCKFQSIITVITVSQQRNCVVGFKSLIYSRRVAECGAVVHFCLDVAWLEARVLVPLRLLPVHSTSMYVYELLCMAYNCRSPHRGLK